MDKNEIIGVYAGLALSFFWMLLYSHFVTPLAWLIAFFNFLFLPISCIFYWDVRLLRCIFLAIYVLYFGYLGFMISQLVGNSQVMLIIIPLLLVPYLNIFVFFVAVGLWLGIIGLGHVAFEALIHSSFFSAPFFVVLLTEKLGKVMGIRLKKFELNMLENRIKEMEMIIEKSKDFFADRNQLERKIEEIISLDPSNFSLKAALFRKYAQTFSNNQIQTRTNEIDVEIEKMMQSRKQFEEKLGALESEKGAFEKILEEVNQRLHKFEIIDPANVKIKLQNLQKEWKNLGKKELENIKTTGELEHSYKEQLLLKFQIEDIDGKIKEINEELTSAKLAENALIMEKLILELEKLDRDIKREEPRLLQISGELRELRIKRDQIKRSLHTTKNVS